MTTCLYRIDFLRDSNGESHYFIDAASSAADFEGYTIVPRRSLKMKPYHDEYSIDRGTYNRVVTGDSNVFVRTEELEPLQDFNWFVVEETNDQLVFEVHGDPNLLLMLKLSQ